MKRMLVGLWLLLWALAWCALPARAQMPPLPHAFYGSVEVNGAPAPAGTPVEARGAGVRTGIQGNPINVDPAGQYGAPGLAPKLVVQGNVANGTRIEFYVGGQRAQCALPGGAWQDAFPYEAGAVTNLCLRVGGGSAPAPTSTPTATRPPATATPVATALPATSQPTAAPTASATVPAATSQPVAAATASQAPSATAPAATATAASSATLTAAPPPTATPRATATAAAAAPTSEPTPGQAAGGAGGPSWAVWAAGGAIAFVLAVCGVVLARRRLG